VYPLSDLTPAAGITHDPQLSRELINRVLQTQANDSASWSGSAIVEQSYTSMKEKSAADCRHCERIAREARFDNVFHGHAGV